MTGRDRLLVSGLAVFVALAGFWFAILAPKRGEASRLDSEVAAVQRELDEANRLTAAAVAAKRSYGEDSAAVAALGKALPADDQTASLLYQLDAAAGRSNVKLKSISPAAAAAPGGVPSAVLPAGITEMSLSLSFEGRFADLQHFLRRVHSYTSVRGDSIRVQGRMLNVQGFQLTSDGSENGKVQATVSASAYIAGVAVAPPAGAATPGATADAPSSEAATTAAPPTQAAMVGVGG